MCPMLVETVPVSKLRPYTKNPRAHSERQIWQIANSIKQFGFTNPILISDDDEIIAGHGRVCPTSMPPSVGPTSSPITSLR
jgi:ParB-like chromosome segregation protein Spo0J